MESNFPQITGTLGAPRRSSKTMASHKPSGLHCEIPDGGPSWVILLENQEAGRKLLRFHCADHSKGLTAQVQKDTKCNFPAQLAAPASESSEARGSLRPGRAPTARLGSQLGSARPCGAHRGSR